MPEPLIPPVLGEVFAPDRDPDAVFSELLPALGDLLQCDRCFLYLRNPETRLGKVPYCWRRHPSFPDVTDTEWKPEPESLEQEDPLFAAALRAEPSVYVEDVETADPAVVNLAFEQEQFGHRALIHAHLCADGQLWGILQPCVFGHPRSWMDFDKAVMNYVERAAAPIAIRYVQHNCPSSQQ